ncbi:MAG: class I SAM-dependent methyltransferase [Gemmatimonadetes bacterium]|nr:class I SAM-dependent methyltransferase [Gemmatimonadota bacterium]
MNHSAVPRFPAETPRFPARGFPRTEADISFPRRKPRWIALSLTYRLVQVARWIVGDRALLRFFLNANWICWRFSYELSWQTFGGAFRNTTYCVSDDLLARWIPAGGAVVDIGCGTGRLCHMAGRHAGRVVGIDYDRTLIAQAVRQNTSSHIEFRVGDVTTALPGEQFDVALLVAVLEHIEDVDSLLRSIRTVAPTLIVEVPDFDADPLNLVRRDLACVWYTDADHVREYTQPVLEEHLARNGWTPVEWERRGGMMLAVCERSEPGEARSLVRAGEGAAQNSNV